METSRCLKMTKVEKLRELMNGHLTAMVEVVCELYMTTMTEYEEKLLRSRSESKPKPSDGGQLVSNSEIQLAIKQEQQRRSYSLAQNAMDAFAIKKEPEGGGSIVEGECHEEEEDYPSILTDTQQVITTNQIPPEQQDENPRPPHSNQDQETSCTQREDVQGAEENQKPEHPGSSSAQEMEIDGDCDREALQSDAAKALNSSEYETEDSDDDDWKRMPAQQPNIKPMKNTENPESEQMKKLASNCDSTAENDVETANDLQSDSSEPETEDSDDDDWNFSRKLNSGLPSAKPTEVPESSSESSQALCNSSIRGKGSQPKRPARKCTKAHSQNAAVSGSTTGHTANARKPSEPKKQLKSSASKERNCSSSLIGRKTKEPAAESLLCSVCNKVFKKKPYWVLHMKMHKVERAHRTTHPGGNS